MTSGLARTFFKPFTWERFRGDGFFFEKSPPNINGFSGALNVGSYCNVH